MGATVTDIQEAAIRLRAAREAVLLPKSSLDVVEALSLLAERCLRGESAAAAQLETLTEPFPFSMVRPSLNALLQSMSRDSLRHLQKNEGVTDSLGYVVVGHVIAGNTPLLAWTSVVRALLVRSASLVKLPTGSAAQWGRVFHTLLAETDPSLVRCVEMWEWAGGTRDLDETLALQTDCLIAYGDDATIEQLQGYRPQAPFLGYGHRLSMGIALTAADGIRAAADFARDVLTYDQSGCLSPHSIYVIGDVYDADDFAERLAVALRRMSMESFSAPVTVAAAAQVRRHRTLARMMGDRLWEDTDLRYTVVRPRRRQFAASPTHGVINVQSLSSVDVLPEALAEVTGALQGCAVAASGDIPLSLRRILEDAGVSYVCRPGELQTPPIEWRQNGMDVLKCLTPAVE
ncbi:MAG: acyl-CoA reductase [Capsulimonas sp.]|uniref:acyl-CoA reductase n=1 Tax=Capsulimonas sp. TaxID=2494211 RepID=UPI00326554D1